MAATVSTTVVFGLFSLIVKVCGLISGISFTLETLTVMVAESVNVPVPSSATCSERANVVVVS